MPNHMHILMTPKLSLAATKTLGSGDDIGETLDAVSPLSKIMHSLKSYTANEANRLMNRSGAFWQRESYDHWIRDDNELERVVQYIIWNPVKAGLAKRPEHWQWGSCYDRYQVDGNTSGWLA